MRRLLNKPVPPSPDIISGLSEITAWGEWFAAAHEQRLRDLDLPADQFECELAACRRQGEAIVAKMRSDFLLFSRPR
jgi:hypothetical protein